MPESMLNITVFVCAFLSITNDFHGRKLGLISAEPKLTGAFFFAGAGTAPKRWSYRLQLRLRLWLQLRGFGSGSTCSYTQTKLVSYNIYNYTFVVNLSNLTWFYVQKFNIYLHFHYVKNVLIKDFFGVKNRRFVVVAGVAVTKMGRPWAGAVKRGAAPRHCLNLYQGWSCWG